MSDADSRRHLRVVPPGPASAAAAQMTLFGCPGAHVVVVAPMTSISGWFFLEALRSLRPPLILDLRVLPRFDRPGLGRARAFRGFEEHGSLYMDIAGLLKIESRRDARMNPALLAAQINHLLPRLDSGPLLFLTESRGRAHVYARSLLPRLHDPLPRWDVSVGWEGCRRASSP